MKPWLLALLSSRRRLIERTFTSNATVVIPEGVSSVDMAGFGARGTDAQTIITYTYSEFRQVQAVRRSDGGLDYLDGGTRSRVGPTPANYCDDYVAAPSDPVYAGFRAC